MEDSAQNLINCKQLSWRHMTWEARDMTMRQQQRLGLQQSRPITWRHIHQAALSDGQSRIQHHPRAPIPAVS